MKHKQEMSDAEVVFGDIIKPITRGAHKPMSPRISLVRDRDLEQSRLGDGTAVSLQAMGMGIKDGVMGKEKGGSVSEGMAELEGSR
jgi:hypothetical protein